MDQERLSNLAMLYIHKEYPIDFQNIIDRFGSETTVRIVDVY
jgi:hypothetical protein